MPEERWYIAVLVVRSHVASEFPHEPSNDLQYRLVRADNPEAAYSKAMALGQEERTSYKNSEGEEVTWAFLGLRDLAEVPDSFPSDGLEVYSRLSRGEGDLVVPKERLSVFWLADRRHLTCEQVLEGDE